MNTIIAIMKYLIANEPSIILLKELRGLDKANLAEMSPASKLRIVNANAEMIEISISVIFFL